MHNIENRFYAISSMHFHRIVVQAYDTDFGFSL